MIRSPKEIHEAALGVGVEKINKFRSRPVQTALQAVAAGAYISLGAMLSVVVGFGFPECTAANPGLQRLLSGLAFPIGLTLIVVLGGELFTGNNALLVPGCVRRHYGPVRVVSNWLYVWTFNFVGALIFVGAFVAVAGTLDAQPWHDAIQGMASAKVEADFLTVFVKGIGANWCVCLAIWLALSAHTLVGKVLGCWLPVMAFVALGFEHCIANMFFIPAGIVVGAPVGVGEMLTANLIPATLGNIVGGALLVGGLAAVEARR